MRDNLQGANYRYCHPHQKGSTPLTYPTDYIFLSGPEAEETPIAWVNYHTFAANLEATGV